MFDISILFGSEIIVENTNKILCKRKKKNMTLTFLSIRETHLVQVVLILLEMV